jgi:peptide/nickel transport system permease protein
MYGLDRPLAAQFGSWLKRAATLDFGTSFQDHRPVAVRIGEALPYTLALNSLAFLLTLAISVPLGVAQARRPGSPFDRIWGGALFALYAMPSFWVAMLLITLFSVRLGWLPLFGVSSGAHASFLDFTRHLVLPVVCLTYAAVAFFSRMVRSSVLEAAGKGFVLAARARGATAARALWQHAFRNALLPLITLAGILLPALLSGSVIIERIFAWPGLGRLYFDAILARDYPVVLGLTFVTAVATLAASLLADILYAAADPRIRYE